MIPSAFRVQCEFCKREIDARAEGTHQQTSGWVKVRSGGGGHGISLAKRENRWACSYCIDRATRGFLQQEGLF
jgi:hypothetical protein